MTGHRALPARVLIGLALLALVLIGAVGWLVLAPEHGFDISSLKHARQALWTFRDAHPLGTPMLFFGAYVLMATIAIPGAPVMTLAAGALFGPLEGTVLVSFASTSGGTLAMLASRFLFRDFVHRFASQRVQHFEQGLSHEGAFYVLSLRLTPVVPFFVINLLAGLTTIDVATFWWASQLGMLPGSFVFVNAGTQLSTVNSMSDLMSTDIITALILLAALPWLSRMVVALIRHHWIYRN